MMMKDSTQDPQAIVCSLVHENDLEFLTQITDGQMAECLREAAKDREGQKMSPQEQQRHFTNVVGALESTGDTWRSADIIELRHRSMKPIRIQVSRLPVTLGRGPESSVQVHHEEVSSCHCLLERNGLLVTAADMNTTNGTFVNGRPITSCDLCDGDWLRLGSEAFEIRKV